MSRLLSILYRRDVWWWCCGGVGGVGGCGGGGGDRGRARMTFESESRLKKSQFPSLTSSKVNDINLMKLHPNSSNSIELDQIKFKYRQKAT